MNLLQHRLRAPSALTNKNLNLPRLGIYCCVVSLKSEREREAEAEENSLVGPHIVGHPMVLYVNMLLVASSTVRVIM